MNTDRDVELLRRWRSGDPSAADLLFRRHSGAVHAFARRNGLGDPDDFVQETFLACLESAERFREHSSVRTFLLAIARNRILLFHRRAIKDRSIASQARAVPEPSSSLAHLMLRDRMQLVLRHAMHQLSPELRDVLDLSYWQGLGQRDIAERLGVPLGTVASRIRRAKEALRELVASLGPLEESPVAHDPRELFASGV
jgi:RNA polymerase sigma-70 factor (ECF subfamily)